MELVITLLPGQGSLTLSQAAKMVAQIEFSYYHDLDNQLITALDKILKKAKLDIVSISAYRIESRLGPDATGYKIAEAVISGLKTRV